MKDRIFLDDDFDGLLYDVHRKPLGIDLLSAYPELSRIDSWKNYYRMKLENSDDFITDQNLVFRYIIFCYDRASPILNRFMADPEKRKTTAAQYAGFEYNAKGHFQAEVDKMMKCKNNGINKLIIDYIRQFNDPEFGLLLAGYENYWQTLEKLTEQPDSKDSEKNSVQDQKVKNELFKQAQGQASQLSELSTKILRDENKNLQKEFYSYLDASLRNRLGITPEELAGLE